MAHANLDANTNEHGIVNDSKKGYCMLYFVLFLLSLVSMIAYVIIQNGNSVPDITK